MIDRLSSKGEEIIRAHSSLLGRPPSSDEIARYAALPDFAAVVAAILVTDEFKYGFDRGRLQSRSLAVDLGRSEAFRSRPRPDPYLAPDDLEVGDVGPRKILLIGACFLFSWPERLAEAGVHVEIDRILFAHSIRLPKAPPSPLEDYDLQIVQVPLPSIVPDLGQMRADYNDVAEYEKLYETALQRLDLFLDEAMAWADRIPTFVLNYVTPQQNLLGRLLPRYDIRNAIHFVELLNKSLDEAVSRFPNARVIDANHVAAVSGKRYSQGDTIWYQYHNQLNEGLDRELDSDKSLDVSHFYDLAVSDYVHAVWREVRAAYRIIKGADAVKLVCVDLDNTLWRGVIGDLDDVDPIQIIGWPTGIVEALLFLKRRGILLAIISKNDEANVRTKWDTIFQGKLKIDDFAVVKINWRPKSENVAEAIKETNLLPESVLFVDDNPVERAAVRAAFPTVRTLDRCHYLWRRILVGAPELQVPVITTESSRRSDMVRAQIDREHVREAMTRDDFLTSLSLAIVVRELGSTDVPTFSRAFELLNKTNQFNTTGRRWSRTQSTDFLMEGGVWWTFDVSDRFAAYGLVGVVLVRGCRIEQFVMSCRVAGLDVEVAVLAALLSRIANAAGMAEGVIEPTSANAVLRDIYENVGWVHQGGGVWRGSASIASPRYVSLRFADDAATVGGDETERTDEIVAMPASVRAAAAQGECNAGLTPSRRSIFGQWFRWGGRS